jgi:hypothetical protein
MSTTRSGAPAWKAAARMSKPITITIDGDQVRFGGLLDPIVQTLKEEFCSVSIKPLPTIADIQATIQVAGQNFRRVQNATQREAAGIKELGKFLREEMGITELEDDETVISRALACLRHYRTDNRRLMEDWDKLARRLNSIKDLVQRPINPIPGPDDPSWRNPSGN